MCIKNGTQADWIVQIASHSMHLNALLSKPISLTTLAILLSIQNSDVKRKTKNKNLAPVLKHVYFALDHQTFFFAIVLKLQLYTFFLTQADLSEQFVAHPMLFSGQSLSYISHHLHTLEHFYLACCFYDKWLLYYCFFKMQFVVLVKSSGSVG